MRPSRTAERHARMEKFRQSGVNGTVAGASAPCVIKEEIRDGVRVIVARFVASGDIPGHEVALVGLDPDLPFAAVLRDVFVAGACTQRAISSRRSLWGMLKRGLLRFLLESGGTLDVVDDMLLVRFANWLNSATADGSLLALRTRHNYYRKAVAALKAGCDAGVVPHRDRDLDWRANPWAGQQIASPPSKAFQSAKDMTTILKACRLEVEALMATIEPQLIELMEARSGNPVVAEAERIRAILAAKAGSARAIDLTTSPLTGDDEQIHKAAVKLLMPGFADLVPFLLLMAHYTGFNQSTLLSIRIDGIRRRSMGGSSWVIVEAYKPRSAAMQRATFAIDDSSTNPDRLLAFVERWTAAMREMSSSPNLWLVRTNGRINDLGDPRTAVAISTRLRRWLPLRNLPHTSISAIRKGILDLAHLASGGDEAEVRRIGGQRSSDVIHRHYTSQDARRRDRERLASGVQELERLIGSHGRVDARRLPDTTDRSAATPGFVCADRYASPIPGEQAGRPCQAYGHCPICPLAFVDFNSPRSCGYLHLLLDRIETGLEGNTAASAANYIAIWLPIAQRLRSHWLRHFADGIRAAAKQLDLVALPEIE